MYTGQTKTYRILTVYFSTVLFSGKNYFVIQNRFHPDRFGLDLIASEIATTALSIYIHISRKHKVLDMCNVFSFKIILTLKIINSDGKVNIYCYLQSHKNQQ